MPDAATEHPPALRSVTKRGTGPELVFHLAREDDPTDSRCHYDGRYRPVDPDDYPENHYRWCHYCTRGANDG